ncbi:MAG: Uma2 family endonuclease [Polyangiales bacterium]
MNSPRSTPPVLLAPGASSSYVSARAPGRGEAPPPLDERLAQPETHTQVVDGVTVRTMGANPPHATQHMEVSHVFRGCLAQGYRAAVDMLTRLDADNDRAADVSVFPEAPDAKTGRRQLEEITFEVCDSQRTGDVSEKARRFVARGVRRVFYVRVDEGAVYEWRRASDAWDRLGDGDAIEDRCFVVPIPVQALLQRVLADDTVARALLARGNAVVVAAVDAARAAGVSDGRKAGRDEGLKAGRDEGALVAARALLLRTMELRRLAVTDAQRARVAACDDLAALTRWHDLAVLAAGADEVFA